MKHIKTFESFINENLNEGKRRHFKVGNVWHWDDIRATGFESGKSAVAASVEGEDAAKALVAYWEKKTPFESSGFKISPDDLKKLENISKVKPFEDVVKIALVDSKTDQEWKCTIILRDEEWGLPAEKSLYAKVGKDWEDMKNWLRLKIRNGGNWKDVKK